MLVGRVEVGVGGSAQLPLYLLEAVRVELRHSLLLALWVSGNMGILGKYIDPLSEVSIIKRSI